MQHDPTSSHCMYCSLKQTLFFTHSFVKYLLYGMGSHLLQCYHLHLAALNMQLRPIWDPTNKLSSLYNLLNHISIVLCILF